MGQQITVDDEGYALATELAALRGESLAASVTAALREQAKKERAQQAEFEALSKTVAEFAALFGEKTPSSDHGWLYDDETGLPV